MKKRIESIETRNKEMEKKVEEKEDQINQYIILSNGLTYLKCFKHNLS